MTKKMFIQDVTDNPDYFVKLLLLIAIPVSLYSVLQNFVDEAMLTATGVVANILPLVPLFYLIMVFSAVVLYIKYKDVR